MVTVLSIDRRRKTFTRKVKKRRRRRKRKIEKRRRNKIEKGKIFYIFSNDSCHGN